MSDDSLDLDDVAEAFLHEAARILARNLADAMAGFHEGDKPGLPLRRFGDRLESITWRVSAGPYGSGLFDCLAVQVAVSIESDTSISVRCVADLFADEFLSVAMIRRRIDDAASEAADKWRKFLASPDADTYQEADPWEPPDARLAPEADA